MASEEQETSKDVFIDVGRVFSGVLLAIILFAVLAAFVGLVAEFLYAIVAFLFFLVPQRLLEKRKADPETYGMTWQPLGRGIAWGIGATLLTLPFFIPGYWIWETYFLDREFEPDVTRYRQWDAAITGEPRGWGEDTGVWVWSDRDQLRVGIRNAGSRNNRVYLRADEPFEPTVRGTASVRPLGDETAEGPAREWIATLTHARSRGVVTIRGPDTIRLSVEPVVEGIDRWPLYQGPTAELVEAGRFEGSRGLMWIVLWLLTQFILVAFPEEYFYRGFIQTRLEQAFELRAEELGTTAKSLLGFTPAIFITSILFGIGHLLVPVGGVLIGNRMSVFFPALLFGWLRRKTGSIVAPTIYHAFSNAMVLVAAVHFV